MKIVSVILSDNREAFIGDCIKSLPESDLVLIVDSGITDKTLDIARELIGDKLVVRQRTTEAYKADPEGFASQRNFGLARAQELGADWIVTLDTDERFKFPDGFDLRALLASFPQSKDRAAIQGRKEQYVYHKNKFFRTPVKHWYIGGVHEDHDDHFIENTPSVPGYFWEVARNRDPAVREEELAYLLECARRNPLDPRWPYFAGQTMRLLGQLEESIEQYAKSVDLGAPAEMAAMSMFFASQSAMQMEQYDRAVDLCVRGMRKHPGVAELYWQAAVCEMLAHNYPNAMLWAHHAVTAGDYKGIGGIVGRSMEKVFLAQYSGPWDVLRRCYGAMGMITPHAIGADSEWQEALKAQQAALTG
jgi:tetratricopeptide (TPR) repeat protein